MEKLSDQQKELHNKIVHERKSIFFTGCGGSGKSFVLSQIISSFRNMKGMENKVAVTASTGKAAFNIEGSTLHSFAGIGLGAGTTLDLLNKVQFNKNASQRWKDISVLIIDEISMIDGETFDKLEHIARNIRKVNKVFGGIQLVLVGDLLQLPPVSEENNDKKRIIEANTWSECIEEYILLTKIFRQQDIPFIRVLTCIRVGSVTDEVLDFMKKLQQERKLVGDSKPVYLYATKNRTNQYNESKLSELNSETVSYLAKDNYLVRSASHKTFDQCQANYSLDVKLGAQVMLVKNINKDLVNGTVGTIINFVSLAKGDDQDTNVTSNFEKVPVVRFDLADGRMYTRPVKREVWENRTATGKLLATRRQIPLILAWAITIHKSQGQTIQKLVVDISNVFEAGQMYTALSRAVSPDSLQVIGFDSNRVMVDNISLKFCIDNNLI